MDILSSLAPSSTAPTTAPAPAENESGAQLQPEGNPNPQAALEKYPFLSATVDGQIPGFFAPKGWKAPSTKDLTPDLIFSLGLGFYKPHDPTAEIAVFNPKVLPEAKLKQLDQAGELPKALTSIAQFVPHEGGSPADAGATTPPAPEASPEAPSTNPVPVLPRPTFSPSAQRTAERLRAQNIAGKAPSDRPIPGAGAVLNGLIQRTV